MGLFGKSSPAKELLGELVALADACGFWVIRKRPRLLRAFQWTAGILGGIFLIGLFVAPGAYAVLRFYTGYIPYFGDLNDSKGFPLDWSKLGRADYKNRESIVRDNSGRIIGRFFVEIRDSIKIGDVPPLLVKGFVAAEDKRFYSHSGIDFRALIRASSIQFIHWIGWRYGQKSGASGISQQAARQIYADEVNSFRTLEQSLPRKVKEARVAIQLEKRYSKDRIMEVFLNSIYFGHGVNGVAEAVLFYFGKDMRKEGLTLREVAILVGLNKSAAKYCPIFHEPKKPKASSSPKGKISDEDQAEYEKELLREMRRVALARDRYNWVLGRMFDDGDINYDERQSALFTEDDPPNLALLHITALKSPEFGHGARMVKELLLVQGYEDENITHRGGLRIATSFDSPIQTIVSEELARQYQELNREITTKEKIEGSAIVIENKTGKIVALVGSHDFAREQFNRVLSLRSPGSLFKVFTLADAIENHGMDLYTQVCNCPFSLPDKIDIHGRVTKLWTPQNFKERNAVPLGLIDLATVGIRSVNLGALDIARRNGIESVIRTANLMGVRGNKDKAKDPDGNVWFRRPGADDNQKGLEPYLPTAIGGSGASLLELASALGIFARGGIYMKPSIIQEIGDSEGKLLYEAPQPETRRVLSERTARLMTVILRAATKIGTSKLSMRGIEQQVACKTGTSNGPEDLSIGCFTPEYTILTRWGYDKPKAISVPGYMKRVSHDALMQVSGGWVTGPLVRRIVDRMYRNRTKVSFSPEVESELKDLLAKYES